LGGGGIVHIVIDKRESELFGDALSALGANVEWKQLDLGDFLCSDRTVVERKASHDFEASIVDRRLFNQLRNMKEHYPNAIVIVEGKEPAGMVSRPALLGAYASMVTDFGAGVFFTKDMNETAELVFAIAKHEQYGVKEISMFAKRKALTLSQSQEAIVEMFPMVGPKMAKKLLLHFGDLENLMTASKEELMEVEGLGEKKAKVIRKTIENEYSEDAGTGDSAENE
jgi:Fanconi anemia group M protein